MGALDGRVALVTGSGRGIGQEVALQLAAHGAKVVVNDLDEAPAQETLVKIKAAGGEAVACLGSVTDPEFPQRMVDTAVDNFGDIHIIVNNAGYTWDCHHPEDDRGAVRRHPGCTPESALAHPQGSFRDYPH